MSNPLNPDKLISTLLGNAGWRAVNALHKQMNLTDKQADTIRRAVSAITADELDLVTRMQEQAHVLRNGSWCVTLRWIVAVMLIQDKPPTEPGLYVAYVNDDAQSNYASRIILFWGGGRWNYPFSDQRYREHVYGWLGPLPSLELTTANG